MTIRYTRAQKDYLKERFRQYRRELEVGWGLAFNQREVLIVHLLEQLIEELPLEHELRK